MVRVVDVPFVWLRCSETEKSVKRKNFTSPHQIVFRTNMSQGIRALRLISRSDDHQIDLLLFSLDLPKIHKLYYNKS